MQMMSVIASNPLLNIAVISWFVAQVIKTALNWAANGHLDLERLPGSGGMPSSHSSLCLSRLGWHGSRGINHLFLR